MRVVTEASRTCGTLPLLGSATGEEDTAFGSEIISADWQKLTSVKCMEPYLCGICFLWNVERTISLFQHQRRHLVPRYRYAHLFKESFISLG